MLRFLGNIIIFFLAMLTTICCLEAFTQAARIAPISRSKVYSDIGKGLRNTGNSIFFNEGFGISKTNEQRFIGHNVYEKDSTTFRIALFGDSFVEGLQVFERDHFANLLESNMSQRMPQKNIEIMNFGRNGFNILDMYAYKKVFAESFNIDLSLFLIGARDFDLESNSIQFLEGAKIVDSPVRIMRVDSLMHSSTSELRSFMQKYSAIALMLNNGVDIIKKGQAKEVIFGQPLEAKELNMRFFDPKPDNMIFSILNEWDHQSVIVKRDRELLPEPIIKALTGQNIPYWDLTSVLDSLAKTGEDPRWWEITKRYGHWTPRAHSAIADYLSKTIETYLAEQ